MFNEFVKGKIMEKKEYIYPAIEIAEMNGANLMLTISEGNGNAEEHDPHMPGRRGDMIP
jgi:hypothetical protein